MSALVQTLLKNNVGAKSYTAFWKKVTWAKVSETFWFCTSFVLSLALGPFAAIPVLIALFTIPRADNGNPEPEAL